MRIVYLHQYFKTNKDNGGTRSYEFAKELVRQGHEVIMITGERISTEYVDGIKIISTETKYNQKMNKIQRIKAFSDYFIKSTKEGLKIDNIDLVYATSTPLTIGIPAIIIKKIKKCKMIFEVRDVWPDIPIQLGIIKNKLLIWCLKKFEQSCYRNANHIVALSDGMKKNIIKKGVSETKVTTITNIANIELYSKSFCTDNIKESIELVDKFICVHPGSMGKVNGLEFILNVAENIHDKDIVFLLIGEGSEKEKLKRIKEEKKLDNVIIKDAISKERIVEVIKSSDLGIMCVTNKEILKDNSANKFFDFLAAGLPIFINYGGWQSEVLKNGGCGYSFKFEDHKSMARQIVALKNDTNYLKQMRCNSKKVAINYSLSKNLNKLTKVINEVGGI